MTGGPARDKLREHLAFGAVLAVVAAGFVMILLYHWRRGTVLIGGALLLAAGLRAALSKEQAGLIAIRGRGVDVLSYAALGTLIVLVAVTITKNAPD